MSVNNSNADSSRSDRWSGPGVRSDAVERLTAAMVEDGAPEKAASSPARAAHAKPARCYARLSTPPSAVATRGAESARARDMKRRQSELLDEALMASFPASDPVSVAFVG